MSEFKWAAGFHRPKHITAEEAHRELDRIREHHGRLTPKLLLEEERDSGAALHSAFDWADSSAAEKYRLQQAHQLIRAIVVMDIPEEPGYRNWVLVRRPEANETEYAPAEVVVQDRELLADAKERLAAEVRSARHSLEELSSLARRRAETMLPGLEKAGRHLERADRAIGRL